jgi:hypothetical protein
MDLTKTARISVLASTRAFKKNGEEGELKKLKEKNKQFLESFVGMTLTTFSFYIKHTLYILFECFAATVGFIQSLRGLLGCGF